MRPADRDAGSRRRALKAAAGLLALLCAGCTPGFAPRRNEDGLLEPLFAIAGARLITRVDISGAAAVDGLGAYVPFIHPVAAAASLNDIYVADAGAARLYRYDRTLDAMAVLPEPGISRSTRLQTGPDGTVYVLDPLASEIRRYTRAGRRLPALRPRQLTSRYAGFAVDPLTGKGYAVDSAHLCIDEIQPLGHIAIEFLRLDEPGPIASDGRSVFVGHAGCGCVVEWVQGRPGRRLGAGRLRQPLSLALLGTNVFAIDGSDGSVALVHEEGVEARSPGALGLLMPETLGAGAGMLLVADGAGRRVAAFRAGAKLPR